MDYSDGKIIILNEYWQYLGIFENQIPLPVYAITTGNKIYVINNNGIYKLNITLSIIQKYDATGLNLIGMYYNSTNDTIYVSTQKYQGILIFSLDLILLDYINLTSNLPTILQGYYNQLYVGTNTGNILIIENKLVIKSVYLGGNSLITSILFDNYGYVIVGYYGYNYINLYYSNFTDARYRISNIDHPFDLKFDSFGRFVILTWSQITVHY